MRGVSFYTVIVQYYALILKRKHLCEEYVF